MYEKFWSGPTPMYAPPFTPMRRIPSSTCRYESSLETTFSDWKNPPGSERRRKVCAKLESGRAWVGAGAAGAGETGAGLGGGWGRGCVAGDGEQASAKLAATIAARMRAMVMIIP